MKLGRFVESKRCTLEETSDPIESVRVGEAPKYEVFAPEGFHFEEGSHSLLCANAEDVKERLNVYQLEPCEEDCDCREDQ